MKNFFWNAVKGSPVIYSDYKDARKTKDRIDKLREVENLTNAQRDEHFWREVTCVGLTASTGAQLTGNLFVAAAGKLTATYAKDQADEAEKRQKSCCSCTIS